MRRLIMMYCVLVCLLGGAVVHAGVQEEAPENTRREQPAQAPQEQNKVQAWNAYADLSFAMDRAFWASYRKYFLLMGTKAQVVNPGAEKLRSFAMEVPNDNRLKESIPKALGYAMQGTSELDITVAALTQPLQQLWAAMLGLSNYLKNKDYLDDDYAKFQQFHTIILENRAVR